MTQIDEPNLDELREQLEEFAISLKPGTTKGKHRTAVFDTLELAKLVQALIATQIQEARINELKNLLADDGQCICQLANQEVCDHNWSLCNTVKDRIAQLRSTK